MKLINRMALILLICLWPGAAAAEVIGQNDKEVQAEAEPLLDTMMEGFAKGNYGLYAKDFDDTLKELISEEKFSKTRKEIMNKFGNYKSRTYLGFLTKGKTTQVMWKGKFDKGDDDVLIRLAVSRRGDRNRVLGLYFQ